MIQKKYISIFLILLYLKGCYSQFETIEEFGPEVTEENLLDWEFSTELLEFTSQCDNRPIVGGFGKFSQGFEATRVYTDLKPHSRISLSVLIWALDQWQAGDFVTVELDDFSIQVQKPNINFQNLCGDISVPDDIVPAFLDIAHTGSTVTLKISDNFSQPAANQSWGFSQLLVQVLLSDGEVDGETIEPDTEISPRTPPEQTDEEPMTDGEVTEKPMTDGEMTEKPVTDGEMTEKPVTDGEITEQTVTEKPTTEKPVTEEPVTDGEDGEDVLFCINSKCFNTQEELQKCVDVLDNLDTSEANNTSIQNDCVPYISTGNRQMFFFSINYTEGFQVDGDCLDTKIFYEGQEFVDGEDFTFDKDRQFFKFDIPLQDFDDKYKCERLDTEENIVWKCKIKHSILLGDEEQVDYSYKIQVTLDKLTTGTGLDVNIIRQEIEGFCCENQLQVQTALEFCSDFECSETLESPIQVKRQAEFIVRHFIVSPEFKFFYLLSPQINLDRITPTIVDSRSDVGEHVLKVKSPVAGKNFNVTVISRLSSTPAQTSLRRLQFQGEVGDDYRVRADGQISIVGEDIETQQDQTQSQEELQQKIIIREKEVKDDNDNTILIVIASVIGVLLIGAILFAGYMCKKQQRQQNYLVQQQQL